MAGTVVEKTNSAIKEWSTRRKTNIFRNAVRCTINKKALSKDVELQQHLIDMLNTWAIELCQVRGYTVEQLKTNEAEFDLNNSYGIAYSLDVKRKDDASSIYFIVKELDGLVKQYERFNDSFLFKVYKFFSKCKLK